MSATSRLIHQKEVSAHQRVCVWQESRPQGQITDILYRAGHIGGMTQQGRTEAASDLYLRPPVKKFPLMGYKSSREIVEAGYRYAMEQIPSWRLPA